MPHLSTWLARGLASAAIGCWAVAATGVAAKEEPVFPYAVETTTLDNGLKVVAVPIDSPGVLSYYTIVRTGSRNEIEPGLSGFAHFFEHMMFRGTPRYTQEQYNDKLKQLGADTNAFTTDDWTCYHATASADALATIAELEADRFQNLSYDVAAFQKEARAVLGEYNKIASSPLMLLDETMQDAAYDRHTYKHTTIGFLKDIVDMPNQYEYSRKFFERWYRPDNCIVLVVGDVRPKEVFELARRHYGGWKGNAARVDIPAEPPQTAEKRRDLVWKGAALPHLYIGYHVPAFDPASRDIAALDVLSEALFSQVSPLYRKLVLDEARVESISAGAQFRRDATLFTTMARLRDPGDLAAVEQEIEDALAAAATTPLDQQRLTDIKSHLRYGFAMSLDSTSAVARTLGMFLELAGDPRALNETYRTYEQVTAEDVQRVARQYFAPTNRTVVTLLSEKDAAARGQTAAAKTAASGASPAPALSPKGAAAALADAKASQPTTKAGDPASGTKDKSPLVSLRIAFRAGSQNDPPGKEGLAVLTARMLAEGGSRELAYAELLERLYPLGAQMGGHCDKEMTVFTGEVHRDKLDEFYRLLLDTLVHPRFDPSDFARLKQEQINYLATRLRGNDDENLGKWTLQLMLYPPTHPYGHVDQGTLAGLESITLDDVKEFYRAHFGQANVAAAGGIDDAFRQRLTQDLHAGLPTGKAGAPELPPPARLDNLELSIVEKPTIATAISIGFPIDVTRADNDFYALAVANSAFGEHRTFNGRLMKNMRGKRGLNYGDYAYVENFIQDGGSTFPIPGVPRRQQFFSIWIRPVPHDKAAFALRQAVRELDRLVKDGLTEAEFEATRNFLFHYSKLWVQTQSRRLGYDMDGAFFDRSSLVAELARRLPTMTREQVNAAIRKHLQAKDLAVAIVTDDGARLRDQLLSGKPTPLVYDTQGTPADILAEDKEIESWPLAINTERLRVVPAKELFVKQRPATSD
ncbi:MAG: insulinase family protein [Planctomycetia bacterium]|nr:insulinase family protein [Planctomycetia bacterium]